MRERIKNVLQIRFVRFAIVGGIVFVVAFVLLALLVEYAHLDEIIANVITTIIAVELNFTLNKYFNWKDRRGTLFSQWLKFHGVKAGLILFNQLVYIALVSLGGHYLIVTFAITAVEIVISFTSNDKYIFKEKDMP